MAMAGLMKVQQSSVARRKPYGLMILLAFGVAFLGVMALHMARERRVFNLLIKQKDTELASLYFLLQKERDNGKEAKWKVEEMRAKVDNFRAQKRNLDGRIMEMQSTISSLKEEQRAIQLALDKKQDQIKLMTEAGDNNPTSQMESQVEMPAKVLSVSTDDPSSSSVDLQTAADGDIANSTRKIADSTQIVVDPKENFSEYGHENPQQRERMNSELSQTWEDSQQKNFQIQDVGNPDKQEWQKTVEGGLQGTSNAEGVETKESKMSYKNGLTSEMPNHRQIGRNSADVHSYTRKSKRKRLNKIHKTRRNKEKSISSGSAATTEDTLQSEESKNQYPQNNFPEQEFSEQGVMNMKGQKESKDHGEDADGSSESKPTRAGMSVERSDVQNFHEDIPRNTTSNVLGEMLSKINQQNNLEHDSHATIIQQPKERLDTHQ